MSLKKEKFFESLLESLEHLHQNNWKKYFKKDWTERAEFICSHLLEGCHLARVSA
jgi:hypothetical protein